MDYSIKDAFKSLNEINDDVEVKKEKKLIKESLEEPIHEGYLDQTVRDFIELCVDPSTIETLVISNSATDEEAFNGKYDDLDDVYQDASFADFDCGGDAVIINADPDEEGGDVYYETIADFLEDYNGDDIKIDVNGETVFEGDKYDIPEEMERYYFHSFDAPKYICINATEIEMDESLCEDKLEEKLPKDLAAAYRRDANKKGKASFTGYINKGNTNRRKAKTDYEKATYTVITPEEAIQYKKDGKVDQLRILYNGNLILYREDGYPLTGGNISWKDQDSKKYVNRKGNEIYDTRLMPFNHVVEKVADKIYFTDEKDFPIGQAEKHWVKYKWVIDSEDEIHAERRQKEEDELEDTGAHKADNYYLSDASYYEKNVVRYKNEIKELEAELTELEKKWEAGDISPNEYNKKKDELQSSIETYKKYAETNKTNAFKVRGKYKDEKAKNRYKVAEKAIREPIEKFKELKVDLAETEAKLKELKDSGVDYWHLKGGSYEKKIEELEKLKREMAAIQKKIDELESEATDELKQANLDQTTEEIKAKEEKINSLKAEIDALVHGEKKEALEEDLVNLADREKVEEEKEKLEKEKKEAPIEQVVDPSASIIDDLKDTYIGRAILQCPTCKTLIYKELEKLAKSEEPNKDGDFVYNEDEECPHCGATEGYLLVGQVAKLDDEETEVEEEEEKVEEEPTPIPELEVEETKTEKETFEEGLTDFDEVSFDQHITKYLTEVYENIESYSSVEGAITDDGILIEGIIKFKSGKEKPTTFRLSVEGNNKISGLNEAFDTSNKIYDIEGRIENNAFITENINYKYSIGDQVVEGCTRVNEEVKECPDCHDGELEENHPVDEEHKEEESKEEQSLEEKKSSNKFEVLWYEGSTEEEAMKGDYQTKEFDSEEDAKAYYDLIKDDEGKFGFWVTEREPESWEVVRNIVG